MDFTGLFVIMIVSLISGTMIQVIFSQPLIYNVNTSYGKVVGDGSNSTGISGPQNPQNASTLSKDVSVPIVKIVDPNWCSSVYGQRNIIVNGTSSDNGTGVQVVEVRVDKNIYSTAIPNKPGNWTSWSLPIKLNDTEPHRILARATDYSENQNWDDVTINSPLSNRSAPAAEPLVQGKKTRFAFVEPSFTNAAYGERFYTFYAKYDNVTPGQKVTTDLDFLTANVPFERDRDYFRNFTEHVKRYAPDSAVSIVRDEDLHDGYIFRPDGSNAYDVLFFLHDEYVTQRGYDNLRNFVTNGGTVVFLDGNVFYAQVHYDPRECTSTLVRGHDWQFDGKAAVKSVHERYFNENKQWVGSNFLYGDISEPVHFIDNPFNYTHFEENYVNNRNATILFDYGAQIPQTVLNDNPEAVGSKIATYQLSYGKGTVIMLGLYAQNMANNKDFLQFFDQIILPRALGQPYVYSTVQGNTSAAYWWMNSGKVPEITMNAQSNTVTLTLERSKQLEDKLLITLPEELVGTADSSLYNHTVWVNEKKVSYNQTSDDVETGFAIPLTNDATNVQISTGLTNTGDMVQSELTQSPSITGESNQSVVSNKTSPGTVNVIIPDGAYSVTSTAFYKPAVLSVPTGTSVIWTNQDTELHTVTSGNLAAGTPTGKVFDSGPIASGRTYKHTFSDKGAFDYYCTLHPFMTGRVLVK